MTTFLTKTLGIASILLISLAGFPVASADHGGVQAPETHITVTHQNTENGTVRFTVSVDVPPKYSDVKFYLPDYVTVVSADGVDAVDAGIERPIYEVTTSNNPTIAFTVDTNGMTNQKLIYDLVDGNSKTALIQTPAVTISWEASNNEYHLKPFSEQGSENVHVSAENGVVGTDILFVGNHTTYTRDVDGETIRLIVPNGIEMAENPRDVVGSVASFYRVHELGGKRTMTYFISPYKMVNAFAFFGGEAVVGYRESPDMRRENIWIHESIHIKQSFRTTPETEWLQEGFAQYYSVAYEYRTGNLSKENVRTEFSSNHSGQLENPESWAGGVQYERGTKLLIVLDEKIRNETDGKKTIDAVFRRLNNDTRLLTEAEFKRAINEVTGVTMDEWLEKRTSTNTNLTVTTWWGQVQDDKGEDETQTTERKRQADELVPVSGDCTAPRLGLRMCR